MKLNTYFKQGVQILVIKELNNLNNSLVEEIRKVEAICKDFDGLNGTIFLDTSFNFNKDIKSIFLMYEDSKLVSLISMFMPTRHEAEISAYTLPEYRNKGYFKKMFQKAVNELEKYGVEDILMVCESQSKFGRKIVKKLDAKYDFTEYFLKYVGILNQSLGNYKYLSRLCTPGIEDLETIIDVSKHAFNDTYEDAKGMIQDTFKSEDRLQYATVFEKKFVGIGSVCFDGNQISIYGLGILPEYQGRGLGKELLLLILNDLAKNNYKNITIEVNGENEKAFELYKNNGFQVEISYNYYRRKIS